MSHFRPLIGLAAAASLALAGPAAAERPHGDGPRGGPAAFEERGDFEVRLPSRVADRIRRAMRALNRADERIDDGETAKAVAQLAAVRKHLASAQKSAARRADQPAGPISFDALTRAQHRAVLELASDFDGVTDGDLVDAIAQTLDAVLDGRDTAIDTIKSRAGGDGETAEEYAWVAEGIRESLGEELEAINEALEDDTLTDAARSALEAAKAQIEAQQASLASVGAAGEEADYAGADYAPQDGERRRCRRGDGDGDGEGGQRGERRGPPPPPRDGGADYGPQGPPPPMNRQGADGPPQGPPPGPAPVATT